MKKNKNVVKYRKPLNINIGVVVFIIIFIYLMFNAFTYLTEVHISPYEVEQGTIAVNNVYNGLALRSEKICTSDYSGSVNYYVKEGHFFTTFNEASIGDILADSYANGKPGDIKCATDEVYAQVKQEFIDNQKLADYCRGISSINYVEREEMRTITFMWK